MTVTKDVDARYSEGLNASITFNPSDMGSGIQMNGLGNDYILILINGKRINGDTGGQNDLSIINPANIERIEIVKVPPLPVWLGRYRRCHQYYHEKRTGIK